MSAPPPVSKHWYGPRMPTHARIRPRLHRRVLNDRSPSSSSGTVWTRLGRARCQGATKWLALCSTLLLTSLVSADRAPSRPNCPPGSQVRRGQCEANSACTSDDDCGGVFTCSANPIPFCVVERAQRRPGRMAGAALRVVAANSCDQPCPSSSTCERVRRCVPPSSTPTLVEQVALVEAAPTLARVTPEPGTADMNERTPNSEATSEAEAAQNSEATPSPSTQDAGESESGCACQTANVGGVLPLVAMLLMLVTRRRSAG